MPCPATARRRAGALRGELNRLHEQLQRRPIRRSDRSSWSGVYGIRATARSCGLIASGLAFGRGQRAAASSACWRGSGPARPPTSRLRRAADRGGACDVRPSLDAWRRPGRAAVVLRDLGRAGTVEGFFAGDDPSSDDIVGGLESFSARACAVDVREAYGGARRGPACLLLYRALAGQRVQAAEPVPALDGAARRGRPRRLDAGRRVRSSSPSIHTSSGSGAACGSPDTRARAGAWPPTSPRRCGRSIPTIPCGSTSRCATSA